ncbi:efflux RND transporter periplasmic adaptor subunit [Pseudaminobacter sp. 19-2017]|uniref:Efflux RND transporter periplasmic adaptor subunit n=1 Tax=Pseudaminobacter soli (ex Zhang et al. 2022) TaxID=2831468 RepID=A0A942DYI2_9HYPH|nr:efflux RND transporter periplasmic adaptor subunit [Pseudaminobacter soli]MBS3649951.1 efflux RND transporter periplasmic adaptor subunit [Pseudaminobacter soli]
MAAWKQLAIAILLLAAAGFAWIRYYPGAPQIASQWGLDWAVQLAGAPEQPSGDAGGDRREGGRQGSRQPATVVTAPVVNATINDRLSAIGTGRANASVSVKPYTSGRLVETLVEPGSRVARGDVLARLDSDAEQIAVDRSRIALDDAKARVERVKSLRSSNAATAVQVTEAELAVENARLALRDAELSLERRAIAAPIAGVVGIFPVEAGNHVTADTQIAVIDDRSSILVDFWVPERYASLVQVGAPLTASLIARPGEVVEGLIAAIDNRLDEKSRTLLVRARIPNADDILRAGMSFQVSMRFPGDVYPSVNPLAIQWGSDGAFVWAVRSGLAERVPVRVIQRNTENVLVAGELREGDDVVTEGIHLVRQGAELLVAGAQPQPTPPNAGPRSGS